LFFEAENARICLPGEAHHWTWEGAGRWFYTAEHPAPPARLAVAPWCRERCKKGCVARELRLVETINKKGRPHLRCECGVCGGFVKHMAIPRSAATVRDGNGEAKRKPAKDNPDLIWRAS
jgi:hypothetical protein